MAGRSAVHAKQNNSVAKRKAAAAKALADQAKANRKIVNDWFRQFDKDSNGVLSRQELKELLTFVAAKEPSDTVLDMALASAVNQAEITKAEAFSIVERSASYIKDQGAIDIIFSKFDTDNSGGLDKDELMPLLEKVVQHWKVEGAKVTEADVVQVMDLCDIDGTGIVERHEVLFACARWKNLFEARMEEGDQLKKSSLCAVL